MSHLDCINLKARIGTDAEHCVACGSVIPEGQQVCENCFPNIPDDDKNKMILRLESELFKARADNENLRQNYYSRDALMLFINELSEYKKIGTVEEFREAMKIIGEVQ